MWRYFCKSKSDPGERSWIGSTVQQQTEFIWMKCKFLKEGSLAIRQFICLFLPPSLSFPFCFFHFIAQTWMPGCSVRARSLQTGQEKESNKCKDLWRTADTEWREKASFQPKDMEEEGWKPRGALYNLENDSEVVW